MARRCPEQSRETMVVVEIRVDIRSAKVPFTRVTKVTLTSELEVGRHQPPFLRIQGRGRGRW
jgi:hypothetical protein